MEGERKGEKHQCVVASHAPPPGDLACTLGMCPSRGIEPVTLWFAGRHSNPLSHTSQGLFQFLAKRFSDRFCIVF